MKDKKNIILLAILVITVLIVSLGVTYAYFKGQTGASQSVNVNVQTSTVDNLTFDKCNPINITLTQNNFNEGSGNHEGETCVKAELKANSTTNTATDKYNVYLNIDENEFVYSKIENDYESNIYNFNYINGNTAEIILQVTDPLGNEITSIEGLPYVTQNGISGFDITTRLGLIKIAEDYEIKVSNATAKIDEWQIKVLVLNLDYDQSINAGKVFKAEGIAQKEDKKDKIVEVYLGDTDCTGVIRVADWALIKEFQSTAISNFSAAQLLISDINKSGGIEDIDWKIIQDWLNEDYPGEYEAEFALLDNGTTVKIPLSTNGIRQCILNNHEVNRNGEELNSLGLYMIKEDTE